MSAHSTRETPGGAAKRSSSAAAFDFYYVGLTNCGGTGCDSSPAKYPGGNVVMQDPSTSVLSDSNGFELAFKTFVQ